MPCSRHCLFLGPISDMKARVDNQCTVTSQAAPPGRNPDQLSISVDWRRTSLERLRKRPVAWPTHQFIDRQPVTHSALNLASERAPTRTTDRQIARPTDSTQHTQYCTYVTRAVGLRSLVGQPIHGTGPVPSPAPHAIRPTRARRYNCETPRLPAQCQLRYDLLTTDTKGVFSQYICW